MMPNPHLNSNSCFLSGVIPMSEYNPIYRYIDIVQDIEEDSDKPKREYVGIIEVRKVGTWNNYHFYIGGIIRASDDHTAYLLSKKYCHKIADYLVNMTCDPYLAITTEIAMKPIIIAKAKEEYYDDDGVKLVDVVKLYNTDGEEILVLDVKDFPDLESNEKMPLLEALIKYPVLMKHLHWLVKYI